MAGRFVAAPRNLARDLRITLERKAAREHSALHLMTVEKIDCDVVAREIESIPILGVPETTQRPLLFVAPKSRLVAPELLRFRYGSISSLPLTVKRFDVAGKPNAVKLP